MVIWLFSVSAHEAAHAWTSWKFEDDTAYLLGRVTLNPIPHIDPIGTLLLPIIGYAIGFYSGAVGVPLYVVYPRNGGEGEVLPTVLTQSMVEDALARAAR